MVLSTANYTTKLNRLCRQYFCLDTISSYKHTRIYLKHSDLLKLKAEEDFTFHTKHFFFRLHNVHTIHDSEHFKMIKHEIIQKKKLSSQVRKKKPGVSEVLLSTPTAQQVVFYVSKVSEMIYLFQSNLLCNCNPTM